jgi:protein ImuB
MDVSASLPASSTRRILSLWLPRLPTDRLIRLSPALAEAPLAVSRRANNTLYVHALNRRAEQFGLYRGQPLANAQAMVEGLVIRPGEEKTDAALLEKVADWCERFSPFIACDGDDGLLLDVTGVAHLFGGEAALLTKVRKQLSAQGFTVAAAIAGTAAAARALARFADGHIAAPGREKEAVARLPVAALVTDDSVRRALERAGLKTVAQLAARQRSELADRFGKAFVAGLEALLGGREGPLNPRHPLPDLSAEQRFAEPVITENAIAAALEELARALCDVLEQRGLGARMLEAVFFRADGAVFRIAVKLGAPVRVPDMLLRLLNQRLESLVDPLDPGFGFDLIRLDARLAEKPQTGAASLDDHDNTRWQVAFLVDRLAARLGEHRVLRFVPQDTHIPEAAAAPVPAQDREMEGTWRRKREADDPPRRPLRLFARPEEVTAMAEVPDGPPMRFRWRRVPFEVTRAEGPERIAMTWWKNEKAARDYFRVETKEGQRFWLYREGPYEVTSGQNGILHPRWYLQGIFA